MVVCRPQTVDMVAKCHRLASLTTLRSGKLLGQEHRTYSNTLWFDLSPITACRSFHITNQSLNEHTPKIDEKPSTPYSSLTVGVPREIFPNERRVSLTPQNAALLRKKGFMKVLVERNAGVEAQFLDEQYTAAGATLVSKDEVFRSSDIMLKVRPPLLGQEVEALKEGSTIISFLYPAQNKPIVDTLATRKVDAFAVSGGTWTY